MLADKCHRALLRCCKYSETEKGHVYLKCVPPFDSVNKGECEDMDDMDWMDGFHSSLCIIMR